MLATSDNGESDFYYPSLPQDMLGEAAEVAAAKKLSENEARVTELTDRWKDRWKETQRILEVCIFSTFQFLVEEQWPCC